MNGSEGKQIHTNETFRCTLCGLGLPRNPVVEGEARFCCAGCKAVHAILGVKGELENFGEHPLYREALRSGVIANPELLEAEREALPTVKWHFEVGEMWCPSCAKVISLVLERMEGVERCSVDYATDLAVVEVSPTRVARERVVEAIERLGYRAERLERHKNFDGRLLLALFCALNLMMLSAPVYAGAPSWLHWLSLLFALPVIGYCAAPLMGRAVVAARVGVWGMEALVSIAVVAAFSLSCVSLARGGEVYFDSMGMVVALVLLGRHLEQRAKRSGREGLEQVVRQLPRRARGSEGFRLLKEFSVGDSLVVGAGERIALDGRVVRGEGSCDESLLTGEALPVHKREGDLVAAGSILQRGHLVVEVAAPAEGSTLQRLVEAIGVDLEGRRPYLRAADLLSRYLVPVALLVALGTGLARGLLPALSVLLIACPCAIGIAAPLVEALLLRRMAQLGALVRNREVLGVLGREELVVFDKTGTITEGKLSVQRGLEGLSDEQRGILKGLVRASVHPIALALDRTLEVAPAELENLEEITGRGMRAERALLGSSLLLEEQGIVAPADEGTAVHFCLGGKLVTTIEMADQLRPEISEVLEQLPDVMLLSGDAEPAVAAAGFPRYLARQGPLEKREWILAQGKRVMMVGDGLNDGPALAAADVGVATASSADLSSAAADISLTTHNLRVLPQLRALACRGRRIIWQNLFWACLYNGVGLVVAATGHLPPIFAASAMVLSSFCVILNSWRLPVGGGVADRAGTLAGAELDVDGEAVVDL